jgi:hypothetical protein
LKASLTASDAYMLAFTTLCGIPLASEVMNGELETVNVPNASFGREVFAPTRSMRFHA